MSRSPRVDLTRPWKPNAAAYGAPSADICAAELSALADHLGALMASGATEFRAELAAAKDLLSRATTDLTLLGDGLGPAGLTRLGLAELIETAARQLGPQPLAADLRAAAYIVLCELMTNEVKHAPGSAITVSAAVDGPELVLEVSDDGPGGTDPATLACMEWRTGWPSSPDR